MGGFFLNRPLWRKFSIFRSLGGRALQARPRARFLASAFQYSKLRARDSPKMPTKIAIWIFERFGAEPVATHSRCAGAECRSHGTVRGPGCGVFAERLGEKSTEQPPVVRELNLGEENFFGAQNIFSLQKSGSPLCHDRGLTNRMPGGDLPGKDHGWGLYSNLRGGMAIFFFEKKVAKKKFEKKVRRFESAVRLRSTRRLTMRKRSILTFFRHRFFDNNS